MTNKSIKQQERRISDSYQAGYEKGKLQEQNRIIEILEKYPYISDLILLDLGKVIQEQK